MIKIWIIAIALFLIITFLVRAFFIGYYKKEYSKKQRNTWGAKMYYWHTIFMISGVITTLVIFLLKWSNILNF